MHCESLWEYEIGDTIISIHDGLRGIIINDDVKDEDDISIRVKFTDGMVREFNIDSWFKDLDLIKK